MAKAVAPAEAQVKTSSSNRFGGFGQPFADARTAENTARLVRRGDDIIAAISSTWKITFSR
ncbi:MAG: hypothetical protein RLN76_06300 [Phycisphaeraceae bacterium]